MDVFTTYDFKVIAGAVALCCLLTACASLQGKMHHYDAKIRSQVERKNWNEAKRIIETAEFGNNLGEQKEIANWKAREHRILKHEFAKHLQPKVEDAHGLYMRGLFTEGDEYRNLLNDELPGIPECLSPCIDLAKSQMSNYRALAEMTMAYRDYCKQVAQIDVNEGKDAIGRLEAIDMKCAQVDKKVSAVLRFKEELATAVAQRWAPTDFSQYESTVTKMREAHDEFTNLYKSRHWNARVLDRKGDYKKIEELIAAKHLEKAKRGFLSLPWLIPPEGLQGGMEFNDLSERTRIAGKGIGNMVVEEMVESGLTGVFYHRRNQKHLIISVLVVGRAPVPNKANRQERRDAGRVARLQASAEFVRFLSSSVQANSQVSMSEVAGEVRENFSANTSDNAKAKLSDLFVVATGLNRNKDGDQEVVYILGWRDPAYGGTIVPAKMIPVEGNATLSISPSIGAYL